MHRALGEQKIDVILAKDPTRPIEIEAKNKGVELNLEKLKLKKYINECENHIQRIEEAYEDLESNIPLDADKYKNLDRGAVQALDQYLFRFSKLQYTLGDKVFPLIVKDYEQSEQALPFVDVLNKLEKWGFISNGQEWLHLRQIRNDVTHQDDDEPQSMAQAINNILNQKHVIKKIYLKVKEKAES